MSGHRRPGVDDIGRIPYFADLPADELERLAGVAKLIQCGAQTTLFHEGDPALGLYCLLQGRVKVMRFSPEGRQLIVREFHPGDTFNEVGALDAAPNAATAVADADNTEVLLIPGDVVRDLTARYPELGSRIMRAMARKLRFAMKRVNRLALMDVKQRLCAWLLDNVDESGTVSGISQEDLAAQLGTVRQVIGRALADLREAGLVEVRRGAIRVLDAERIKQLIQQ